MDEKLRMIEAKYAELEARSMQPDFYADPKAAAAMQRELKQLEPIVKAWRRYQTVLREQADLRELLGSDDPEDAPVRELAREELPQLRQEEQALTQEIKLLLLPRDPDDGRSVIMELRAGVGGEESALFAHSLFRMYSMYADARNWSVELVSQNATELGGLREAVFTVSGAGAWSRLKYESGVHRVQRVPETESGGRIHTSTATVAVLPEMEPVEVSIRPEDLQIDTYRSSGAGGQHINKTESAIRITHLPTGTVVECQEERSQIKNREKAMRVLASRLYEAERSRAEAEQSDRRRSQVGSGMRNERIRTYNFPQGRVTDHRVNLTLYQIDAVMDGALDELIDALATAEQAERLRLSEEG